MMKINMASHGIQVTVYLVLIDHIDIKRGSSLADVVGLAGCLQLQTVGFLFLFVRADRNDGLTSPFRACRLVAERA